MHGGSVRAESPGVGRGSTFTLELPIAALGPGGFSGLPHAPGELNAAACDLSVLAGLRVLWVEDEPDTRDVVARILREYGTKVRTAGSVAAALAELEADPPDVLISDIGMPHEDGCTLVRKIRQHKSERIAKIPAIALTALARPEDRERTLAAGDQIHVAKPVDPSMRAQAFCAWSAQPPGGTAAGSPAAGVPEIQTRANCICLSHRGVFIRRIRPPALSSRPAEAASRSRHLRHQVA